MLENITDELAGIIKAPELQKKLNTIQNSIAARKNLLESLKNFAEANSISVRTLILSFQYCQPKNSTLP